MTERAKQPIYFVVQCFLTYPSFEDAKAKAPDEIAAHIKRSKEFHAKGVLVMAGAFLDNHDEPLSTMGVLISREAAEEYLKGDPFYINGMMSNWTIRVWANMFA